MVDELLIPHGIKSGGNFTKSKAILFLQINLVAFCSPLIYLSRLRWLYQEFIIYIRGRVSNSHYTLYKHTASSNIR